MKGWWPVLSLFAARLAIANDTLPADFGNHLFSRDTQCGKRANAILQRNQKKLIAAPAFGLPELRADDSRYAALMKHTQSLSSPLPQDVIHIILFAPRVDGTFRDVYVACPSGRIIFSDRGSIGGQVHWYGPVDLSEAIGKSATYGSKR